MIKGKLLLVIFLGFCLIGCRSNNDRSRADVIRLNLKSDPRTLDPRMARDFNPLCVIRMLFEGLTRIGPGNEVQLALAEKVDISKDLKTYTFFLRPSKWSNKEAVTAYDFVSSWKKVLSPCTPYSCAYFLYLLENGKEIKEGKRSIDDLGVQALDERTLVVRLNQPTPFFLELLSFPIFFPVNYNLDQANEKWADRVESYVSNGPFTLEKWKHNDQIVLAKNPHYWDAKTVKIEQIEMVMVQEDVEMKLFEKKRLHWAGSPLSNLPLDALKFLKSQGCLNKQTVMATSFIRINTEHPLLVDSSIRRGLALGIDRQAITLHVTQGGQLPATGLVPPIMNLQKVPYFKDGDRVKAKQLFNRGLKQSELAHEDFKAIELLYVASERNHLIAQTIQQQWNEALGIQIKLQSVESKVYFDRISKQDYQMAICSWVADFNDPVNFLEVFHYKVTGTNNTNWENATYAELLNSSYKIGNNVKRLQMLRKCEEILISEMPIIPIFHYTLLYLVDERLKGVSLSSLGNLDFKWAYWDNGKL